MARPKTYKTDTPGIRKDDQGRFWISATIAGKKIWQLVGKKTAAKRKLDQLRQEARGKKLFPEEHRKKASGGLYLSDLFSRYRKEDEAMNRKATTHQAQEERIWGQRGAALPR